ncbi:uncharacterized protein METZ01_LOCUS434685, partial [marine metagenome]
SPGIASCDCADFWNQYATDAVFTYDMVAEDQSMKNGKAYILARTGTDPFVEVTDGITGENIFIDVTENQARQGTPITITVESEDFDAETSWWPNEQIPSVADDVEFKIRLEDRAGNTTLTEDVTVETRTIHVDEIDPVTQGSIIELYTSVNNNNGNSRTTQGYWNIDTDKLKVTLSDMSEENGNTKTDDNILGGLVQLEGRVADNDWTELGSETGITDANKEGFSIEVDAVIIDDGINSIKELQGADPWDNMNGEYIQIRAVIV